MTRAPKKPPLLWILFVLACFEVVSAVPYGLALSLNPSGDWVRMSTTMLAGSPFEDFRIPGLILFIVIGLGALLLAIALFRLPAWGWATRCNPWKTRHFVWSASICYGFALTTWIGVEVAMIGFDSWLQPFHFCLGLLFATLPFMSSARAYHPA